MVKFLQRLSVNPTFIEYVKTLPEKLSKTESLEKIKDFGQQYGEFEREVARICKGLKIIFEEM